MPFVPMVVLFGKRIEMKRVEVGGGREKKNVEQGKGRDNE